MWLRRQQRRGGQSQWHGLPQHNIVVVLSAVVISPQQNTQQLSHSYTAGLDNILYAGARRARRRARAQQRCSCGARTREWEDAQAQARVLAQAEVRVQDLCVPTRAPGTACLKPCGCLGLGSTLAPTTDFIIEPRPVFHWRETPFWLSFPASLSSHAQRQFIIGISPLLAPFFLAPGTPGRRRAPPPAGQSKASRRRANSEEIQRWILGSA